MKASRIATGAFVSLALLVSSAGSGRAQEPGASPRDLQPIARASLEPGSVVTVGQPLTVFIEVLVPSFFSGAPNYPDLELRDALVLFVFQGNNFSERIEGVTWAGQRRQYQVYPQRPGSYEIPEIPVGVRFRPPGGRGGQTTFTTASPPSIRFEAVLPPEAEGLDYFISALDVQLVDELDPQPDTIRVGDSFTRTITATVQGALSMVIPPLAGDSVPGLASYPGSTLVEDSEGFGVEATVGQRVESVTYVAQAEGDVVLPGATLQWWDVTAQELRTATVPPVRLTVVADPALTVEIPLPQDSLAAAAPGDRQGSSTVIALARRWGPPVGALAVLVWLATWASRRYLPRLVAARRAAKARQAESEAAYFDRYRQATRTHDPRQVANALVAWLDRWAGPGTTLEDFARESRDELLDRELTALDGMLYGRAQPPTAPSWSGAELFRAVADVRKQAGGGRTRRASRATDLSALNPK